MAAAHCADSSATCHAPKAAIGGTKTNTDKAAARDANLQMASSVCANNAKRVELLPDITNSLKCAALEAELHMYAKLIPNQQQGHHKLLCTSCAWTPLRNGCMHNCMFMRPHCAQHPSVTATSQTTRQFDASKMFINEHQLSSNSMPLQPLVVSS
jgi:hypothetical protein